LKVTYTQPQAVVTTPHQPCEVVDGWPMAVCGKQKITTAHPRVMSVGCSPCSWVPPVHSSPSSNPLHFRTSVHAASQCAPVLISFRLCVSWLCPCLCKLISLLISSLSVLQEGLGFHHMWLGVFSGYGCDWCMSWIFMRRYEAICFPSPFFQYMNQKKAIINQYNTIQYSSRNGVALVAGLIHPRLFVLYTIFLSFFSFQFYTLLYSSSHSCITDN